jgi:hypothetical protein
MQTCVWVDACVRACVGRTNTEDIYTYKYTHAKYPSMNRAFGSGGGCPAVTSSVLARLPALMSAVSKYTYDIDQYTRVPNVFLMCS